MTETTQAPEFAVSDSAVRRIKAMVEQEGNHGQMFRVTVSGGGCSGFQYGFDFAETRNDDDRVFGDDDANVLVDEASLPFLAGAVLEYKEELVGSFFAITNPNASSTCGCGTSFSI
ncbi:MAG: iron-sulfur cluster insertion protein ErpA [Rhodospirillales bacterium]|jgi:iron-sulfur cluster insertion protein|nr:iron-sulfur cluster insertion protein ErpA [Rhodospirillales bacterium]